ncbi:hypothetical protein D3C84_1095420 [compost metagenome]
MQYPPHGRTKLFHIDAGLTGASITHIKEVASDHCFDQARDIAALTGAEDNTGADDDELTTIAIGCKPSLMDLFRDKF